MAKRPLKDFCEMFTGFPISSRDFAEAGDCQVVQLSDVLPVGLNVHLKKTDMPNINPEKILRSGDVLFKARGSVLHAYALRQSPIRAIVTNGFVVLRPNDEVLPHYLAWALNSLQSELEKFAHGSIIMGLSLRDIKEVTLPIPDVESQQTIINVHDEIEAGKALANEYFDAVSQMLRGCVLST
jgi:hypothetical protein